MSDLRDKVRGECWEIVALELVVKKHMSSFRALRKRKRDVDGATTLVLGARLITTSSALVKFNQGMMEYENAYNYFKCRS